MKFNNDKVIKVFRYFWVLASLILIFYLIQQNLVLTKEVNYQVDLSKSFSQNIEGLYPVNRVEYQSDNSLAILAEPLYLQVYSPDEFKQLLIAGNITLADKIGRIGLLQQDNTWLWEDINNGDFNISFDLNQALIDRNKLQLIFSFPDLSPSVNITLNKLEINLQR